MNHTAVSKDLLDYILCTFYVTSCDDVDLDASLVKQEIIDSMGLIEIATFIEKRYGLKISQSDLNQANFGSVNRIVEFVLSRSLVESQ